MNPSSIEPQICPAVTDLKAFAEGAMPPYEIEHVAQHLESCQACVETVRDWSPELEDPQRDQLLNTLEAIQPNESNVVSKSDSGPFYGVDSIDQPLAIRAADQLKQLGGLQLMESNINSISNSNLNQISSHEIRDYLEPGTEPDQLFLDHYRLDELLGIGSSGIVYRAFDTNLNRPVALKILRPSLGAKPRARFLAEARATAAITNPNVVTIYHVGAYLPKQVEDSLPPLAYIAMQWLPGETLHSKLQREGQLSPNDINQIGKQIALGLQAAHEIGLTHRDIKPANIWIAESGTVKILDFGLVRANEPATQLTCTGMIAGTPSYMSPEQACGEKVDHRSDLFSLGALLYECCTGIVPFQKDNVLATIQAIKTESPISIREYRSDLDDATSAIVESLLAKPIDHRPPKASMIASALETPVDQWQFKPRSTFSDGSQPHTAAPNQFLDPELVKPVPSIRTVNRLWFIGAALLLIGMSVAAYFGSPQIIRIMTNRGQLVIETNDDDVKIEVLQDGKRIRIIDLKTTQAIDITAGEYQLQPIGDDNELVIDKRSLSLARGKKEIVRVTRLQSTNDSTEPTPSNELADGTHTKLRKQITKLKLLTMRLAKISNSHRHLTQGLGSYLKLQDFYNVANAAAEYFAMVEEYPDADFGTLSEPDQAWLKDFNTRLDACVRESEERVASIESLLSQRERLSNQTEQPSKLKLINSKLDQLGYVTPPKSGPPGTVHVPDAGLVRKRSSATTVEDRLMRDQFRLEIYEFKKFVAYSEEVIRNKKSKRQAQLKSELDSLTRNRRQNSLDLQLHRLKTLNERLSGRQSGKNRSRQPAISKNTNNQPTPSVSDTQKLPAIVRFNGICYGLVREDSTPPISRKLKAANLKLYRISATGHERTLLGETTSDASGNYRFPPIQQPPKNNEDFYVVVAQHPQFAATSQAVSMNQRFQRIRSHPAQLNKPTEFAGQLDILFPESVEMKGQVLANNGQAVSQMKVHYLRLAGAPVEGFGSTTTDANGIFKLNIPAWFVQSKTADASTSKLPRIATKNKTRRVANLPRLYFQSDQHGFYTFTQKISPEATIQSAHKVANASTLDTTAPKQIAKFELPQTTVVKGRITNLDAIQDSDLSLAVQLQTPFSMPSGMTPSGWQVADVRPNGEFEFVIGGTGKYNLMTFRQTDRSHLLPSIEVNLEPSNPNPRQKEIHLHISLKPAITLVCRVIDESTMQPFRNREPHQIGWHGPERPRTSSGVRSKLIDADGRVSLNVLPGKNHLYLMNAGSENFKLSRLKCINSQTTHTFEPRGNYLTVNIQATEQIKRQLGATTFDDGQPFASVGKNTKFEIYVTGGSSTNVDQPSSETELDVDIMSSEGAAK